jgi:hypothetical protein
VRLVVRSPRPGTWSRGLEEGVEGLLELRLSLGIGDNAKGSKASFMVSVENTSNKPSRDDKVPPEGEELAIS